MIRTLQDRLDAANRKVSVADISIRNLTRERDSADARLGLAYCTSEELKHENQALKAENQALKADNEALKRQLAQIAEEREADKQEWAKKEASLNQRLDQRHEAVNEIRDMTRDLWDLRKPTQNTQAPYNQDLTSNHPAAIEEKFKSYTQPSLDNAKQQKPLAPQMEAPKRKRSRMVIIEETIHTEMGEPEYANQTGTENLNNVYRGEDDDESLVTDESSTDQTTKRSFLPVRVPLTGMA